MLGGGILGGLLLGHTPVCAVEIDPYCRNVLKQRMVDGYLPADMQIHDDIRTFDGTAWLGKVDVVAGGFPCQDLSYAGKRAGLDGEKSSLFFELMRIVREVRPRYLFLENVPGLLSKGFDRVLGEVAESGFDAAWTVLSASDCGANHQRKRIWILCENQNVVDTESIGYGQRRESRDVHPTECGQDQEMRGFIGSTSATSSNLAHSECERPEEQDQHERGCLEETVVREAGVIGSSSSSLADTVSNRRQGWLSGREDSQRESELGQTGCSGSIHRQQSENWWSIEPDLGRLGHGIPDRVGRLKALGNAQVPLVAASAWVILERMLRSRES